MFTAAAFAKLGEWLLSKLTLRNIFYFILLCLAVYGGLKTYNWIYDRGATAQAAIDKPIIDKANGERDQAVATKNEYVAAYNKHVTETTAANKLLAEQNAATVKGLEAKVAKAEAESARKQKLLDQIDDYVPPAADVSLPVGFVRLYGLTLEEGSAAEGSPAGNGVSFRPGEAAAAPSGLTLSGFTQEIIGPNNIEAVQRGVIIRGWQTWYEETKHQFTEAQRKKAEAIPRVPADGKGDGRAPSN